MKRVRLCVDHEIDGLKYKVNQVVDLPDALAKELINNGSADANKEAVAYAVDVLKAEPIVHETAIQRAAKAAITTAQKAFDEAVKAYEAETDAAKRAEIGKACEAAEKALVAAKAEAESA